VWCAEKGCTKKGSYSFTWCILVLHENKITRNGRFHFSWPIKWVPGKSETFTSGLCEIELLWKLSFLTPPAPLRVVMLSCELKEKHTSILLYNPSRPLPDPILGMYVRDAHRKNVAASLLCIFKWQHFQDVWCHLVAQLHNTSEPCRIREETASHHGCSLLTAETGFFKCDFYSGLLWP
jgi:hypothetical protein